MQNKIEEIINSGDRDLANNIFCQAVTYNKLEFMRMLYETQFVDPGANQNEAIRTAAQMGYLEAVKYLSSLPEVDPTAQRHEAILVSNLYGHNEIADYLSTLPCYNPFAANITVEKKNELIGILTEEQLQPHIRERTRAGLSFLFFKESPFNAELPKDIKQIIVNTANEIDNQKLTP